MGYIRLLLQAIGWATAGWTAKDVTDIVTESSQGVPVADSAKEKAEKYTTWGWWKYILITSVVFMVLLYFKLTKSERKKLSK